MSDITVPIGAAVGVATFLVAIGTAAWNSAKRVGKLELKVDTLWDFQMSRARLEALDRGLIAQKDEQKDT